MSTGIRIRGVYGQLQISDDVAINSVLYSGNLGTIVAYPAGGGITFYATGVTFPQVITTTEQPLVFVRVTNSVTIYSARIIGQPGAWTGFSISGTTLNTNVGNGTATVPVYGTWFISTTQAGKSNARYGIRIRNPNTGAIVFDSGFPIAKFLSWTPQFVNGRVVSHGHDNSGNDMWWDWYSADAPIPYAYNGHFILNGFTGAITGGTYKYASNMYLTFDVNTPYTMNVQIMCQAGQGPSIFGPNAWNLVWATPGP